MGLFSKDETKMERTARKEQEILERYGLTEVSPMDIESIRKIIADLSGNGLFKAGMALTFAKGEEQAKVTYLSALVEQNWIIIRQLDRIQRMLYGK